jgi:Lrp/AsnC family transcriptional regulator, leucine-responsive regulatory protein
MCLPFDLCLFLSIFSFLQNVLRFNCQNCEDKFHMIQNSEDTSLDQTDRRLLRALQDDGRITNQALAKACGLSPAACHERVKRLRERGVITGFTALVDPAKLGKSLLVYVEILLDRTTDDVFSAFALHVKTLPEVLECHMVAGGFDYLVKLRVKDMDAYRRFLGHAMTQLPGVRETRTYAVLEEVKSTTVLAV